MSSSIIRLHTLFADALPWLTPMLYGLKMHATNTSTRRSSSVMHHHLSASCVVPDKTPPSALYALKDSPVPCGHNAHSQSSHVNSCLKASASTSRSLRNRSFSA